VIEGNSDKEQKGNQGSILLGWSNSFECNTRFSTVLGMVVVNELLGETETYHSLAKSSGLVHKCGRYGIW
jgi:hypothetical protein